MLIRRDITEEASETKLSDCELLLRKYLDTKYAQIDTLFVLAQVFERHDNNASKLLRLQSTDPIGGTPIGGILRFLEKFYTDPIGGTSKIANSQMVNGQILSYVPPLLDFKRS